MIKSKVCFGMCIFRHQSYNSYTGDPLHSRAAYTQPCNVNTHSRAHCSPGARLCEQWGHGCVNNGARLCASARLCRASLVSYRWVIMLPLAINLITNPCHNSANATQKQINSEHSPNKGTHQQKRPFSPDFIKILATRCPQFCQRGPRTN